jgi:protein SSD1
MAVSSGAFGAQNPMGQFGQYQVPGVSLDGQAQNIPRGHGRRHSVNVVNKAGSQPGMGSISYPNPYAAQDGFEDGFAPPSFGAHSRQVSRADSSWRISMCFSPLCGCWLIPLL